MNYDESVIAKTTNTECHTVYMKPNNSAHHAMQCDVIQSIFWHLPHTHIHTYTLREREREREREEGGGRDGRCKRKEVCAVSMFVCDTQPNMEHTSFHTLSDKLQCMCLQQHHPAWGPSPGVIEQW